MQQVNEITAYIDRHFSESLKLDDLARVGGMSKYHLHRIFRSCTGMAIGEFIQRCRIYRAYNKITAADNKDNILDIALSVGYESHSSFSRAFQNVLGISPTQAQRGEQLNPPGKKRFKTVRKASLKPVYMELDGFQCHGTIIRGYQDRTFNRAATVAFTNLHKALLPGGIDYGIHKPVGIHLDNTLITAGDKCRFFCGLSQLECLPELHLESISFDAGRWACFEHKGPYQSIWQTWTRIYSQWIIPEGIRLRDTMPFERYLNHPLRHKISELITQIYIPVFS